MGQLIKDIALKKASDPENREYLHAACQSARSGSKLRQVVASNEDKLYYRTLKNHNSILFILLNEEKSYVWMASWDHGISSWDNMWGLQYEAEKQLIMNTPLYYLKTPVTESLTIDIGYFDYDAFRNPEFTTHDISYDTNNGQALINQPHEEHPTDQRWFVHPEAMSLRTEISSKPPNTTYSDHITIGDAIRITNQKYKRKVNTLKVYTKDLMKNREYTI